MISAEGWHASEVQLSGPCMIPADKFMTWWVGIRGRREFWRAMDGLCSLMDFNYVVIYLYPVYCSILYAYLLYYFICFS